MMKIFKYDRGWYEQLLALFNVYYMRVTGEDLTEMVKLNMAGQSLNTTRVEAMVMWYIAQGYEILLAADGLLDGFAIYQIQFDCVMVVRAIYLRPDLRGQGLMKQMFEIASADKPIKKLIFQTVTNKPPAELMKLSDGHRKLLHETQELQTWEMTWGTNG